MTDRENSSNALREPCYQIDTNLFGIVCKSVIQADFRPKKERPKNLTELIKRIKDHRKIVTNSDTPCFSTFAIIAPSSMNYDNHNKHNSQFRQTAIPIAISVYGPNDFLIHAFKHGQIDDENGDLIYRADHNILETTGLAGCDLEHDQNNIRLTSLDSVKNVLRIITDQTEINFSRLKLKTSLANDPPPPSDKPGAKVINLFNDPSPS